MGERTEIDIFEDDHLELSRFGGDESIEGGKDLLAQILAGGALAGRGPFDSRMSIEEKDHFADKFNSAP